MASTQCPFPGMVPWVEQPGIWNDLHTRLMTALADELAPRLRPHYSVVIEQRVYKATLPPEEFIRPDVSVIREVAAPYEVAPPEAAHAVAQPVWVALPYKELIERYLEIRRPQTKEVITVIEILSPANKRPGEGRKEYEEKRVRVLGSYTHLVEIDFLRGGAPMLILGPLAASGAAYRILVSRAGQRMRSELYPFGIREHIPAFKLPLSDEDEEPIIHLTPILHAIYARAGYNLQIDYTAPPIPPLPEDDQVWAVARIRNTKQPS